jgi:hypothetical protein
MTKPRKPGGSRQGRGGKRSHHASVSKNGVDYRTASTDGCRTRKWGWPLDQKKGAKTLLRALRNAGDHGSRVYRCPECDRWHVGHLPAAIRDGRLGASDMF